jgi:hypothetical protein
MRVAFIASKGQALCASCPFFARPSLVLNAVR